MIVYCTQCARMMESDGKDDDKVYFELCPYCYDESLTHYYNLNPRPPIYDGTVNPEMYDDENYDEHDYYYDQYDQEDGDYE